ncbi:dienelactone hydrolase family protein [Pinirhizobacter soli]|uniref:dienelactone hydrolase family protein n=1 Tax=Pinirhizobacter soli TaxID=2786953 RepID=UPI00202A573C|nr:dienelactone hydrolase family protein [Pinirhizobacter soli]
MGQTIQITASDGHDLSAFVAAPEGTRRGALVMLQEFFGVNAHIRDMARQYAGDGYHVIAPAIFDRVERGVELGYDEAGMNKGRQLRARLVMDQTMLDVQAAIDAVLAHGPVATLGYCWGGSLAYLAAARLQGVACAVGYYGAQIAAHATETPRAPVLLHFAEHDEYIPLTDVEKIRLAQPALTIYMYPGTEHGFSCNDRRFYKPVAAALARERSLAFLVSHMAAGQVADTQDMQR